MTELLNDPMIQSGFGPFVIAGVIGWLLRGFGWVWAGLGFAIAYYCSVYLVMGAQITPITSTKKIALLGLGAVIVGLILDKLDLGRLKNSLVLILGAAAAATWLVWPVAMRQSGLELAQWMALPALYVIWVALFTTSLDDTSAEDDATTTCLFGFTTGAVAILGASVLLGQLGIAIGAAAGAYVLLSLSNKPLNLGYSYTYPVAMIGGLIGIAAVIYAKLPWYSLIPLAFIPAINYVPFGMDGHPVKRILCLIAMSSPIIAISIYLTWRTTGAPSF